MFEKEANATNVGYGDRENSLVTKTGFDSSSDETKDGKFLSPRFNRVSSLTRCFSSLNLEKLEPEATQMKKWGSVGSLCRHSQMKTDSPPPKPNTTPTCVENEEKPWVLTPNFLIDTAILLYTGLGLLFYHYSAIISAAAGF